MADFTHAINLIRKYEGFSEKACPDLTTGAEPYTIGYGTQYYPDGSPVKRGQFCSKEKALEYLFHEVQIIDNQLAKLNLGLDDCMRQSLISFVHSIGWEPFLYSEVIDAIENEDFCAATENMAGWVFDSYHKVIGGLLDRRREEIKLFLADVDTNPWASTAILLRAFRNYVAADHQVRAIRKLEEAISPYHLAEFANTFGMDQPGWFDFDCDDAAVVFNS